MQNHQGQSTLPRPTALLQSVGVSISKRDVQWLHTEKQAGFLGEGRGSDLGGVHRPDTFTDLHRADQQQVRRLIWNFYADLRRTGQIPASAAGSCYGHGSIASSGAVPASLPWIASWRASTPNKTVRPKAT